MGGVRHGSVDRDLDLAADVPTRARPHATAGPAVRGLRDHRRMTRLDDRGRSPRVDEAALGRLGEALTQEPVLAAYLFGSQAAGTAGPLSDVDIAVWVRPEALREDSELELRLRLASAAAEVLGTEEVQVAILNYAPPLLKHRALAGGVLLVDRDPGLRIRLTVGALLDYLDTRPLREQRARGVRERLRAGTFGRP